MSPEELQIKVSMFPNDPGVYRFLNANSEILYVGKAKNLKKRVISYSRTNQLSNRIRQMVFESTNVIYQTTLKEEDALLLEAKLIKEIQPKYNILLKDDKDYPHLIITTSHDFPKISKFRPRTQNDSQNDYKKGPFISSKALNDLIFQITKMFKIRTCQDQMFKTRKRPCMQYFIKQCSAPCCNFISMDDYHQNVLSACKMLDGNNHECIENLKNEMMIASKNLEYEKAAAIRDQLKILSSYIVQNINLKDTHVVISIKTETISMIKIFFYKNNINFGTKDFFFNFFENDSLESFLQQFYYDFPVPGEILIPEKIENKRIFEKTFKTKLTYIKNSKFNEDFINQCKISAQNAFNLFIEKSAIERENLMRIKNIFNLKKIPKKIEIFDNSHFYGKNAFGCVVVFEDGKFKKSEYRAYKIMSQNTKDDYEMMREVMVRRYSAYKSNLPDLLLIDGGLGQFNAVKKIIDEINSTTEKKLDFDIISIAKGVDRNAFNETFFSDSLKNFKFDKNNLTLFFLERLRDEAHKFAISSSRKSFEKTFKNSELSKIKGLSDEKIQDLFEYFKDFEKIRKANEEDLSKIPSISYNLAKKIVNYFKKDDT